MENDLISRTAAVDALTDTNLKRNFDSLCDGYMNRTRRAAQRVIAQLPAVDAIPIDFLMRYAQLPTEFAIEAWRKPQKEELKRKIRDMDKPISFDDAVRIVDMRCD